MASQNDKSGLSNNTVNSSNENSYKADRNDDKDQESLKNVIKEGGKAILDAKTGGAISKVEKVPIAGKRLNKKLDKAAGKIAKLDKLTGGKLGQAAKKIENAGAVDALKNARGMNNNSDSPGEKNNKESGESGDDKDKQSKSSSGLGASNLFGGKRKKSTTSTDSSDDNSSDEESEKDFDLIGKISGSGFLKSPKTKIIILGGFFFFLIIIGSIAAIIGSDEASEGMVSGGSSGNNCASNTAILEIAEREVGNNEANGTHAKYLSYLGFSPSTAWCAAFVSWCANQAGIDPSVIPRTAAVSSFLDYFKKTGDFQDISSGYTPKPGDLIIWKAKGRSHIGIVKEYKEEENKLITVEGNSSDAVRINTYQYSNLEAQGVVGFANPTQECSENSTGSIAGSSIDIPQNFKQTFATVTCYDYWCKSGKEMIWSNNTGQRRVSDKWKSSGSPFKDGLAVMNVNGTDRYLIAVAQTFGKAGDQIDVYFANGKVLPCIIADSKSLADKNITKYGHRQPNGSINVIEYQIKRSFYQKYGNPGTHGWRTDLNKNVVKIVSGKSVL